MPPGRRRRHALATRRGVPDVVVRGAREEKTARGRTGPRRSSWAEAKAGMWGGCWAGFGRRARSEAAAREEKKYFSKYSFKEFLHAIFQISF